MSASLVDLKDHEGDYMGEVLVMYKVMMDPDSDVAIDDVIASLSSISDDSGTVQGTEKKPLAFGLMYIELTVVIEDAEGKIDQFEEVLQSVSGVGEIEVLNMGRLL
tara:strand:- start:558 stop:875 length:318 start_codon:yes stop_codon:yes gene_type:complete